MRHRNAWFLWLVACAAMQSGVSPERLAAQGQAEEGRPSPETARLLSTLGAVAPLAVATVIGHSNGPEELALGLTAAGFVLGPSVGYVYGGDAGRGMAGAGIRGALAGIGLLGFLGCDACGLGDTDAAGGIGAGLILAAMVHAVRDVVLVDGRVRARNHRKADIHVRAALSPESRTVSLVVAWRP